MWELYSTGSILFYILTLITTYCNGWRPFDIDIIGHTNQIYDNDTFDFLHFELLPFKKRHIINGSLSIKHEVQAFKIHVEFALLRPQSEPFTLINMTTDGCSFLESAFGKVNMLSIILGAFRNGNGYFPDKCPLLPHKTVTINQFYFDPEKFPAYTVDTDFMCVLRLYTQGRQVFSTQVNGSIFTKGSRKNLSRRKG